MNHFRQIIYYALLFMRLSCSSSNEYPNIDVNDFLKKVIESKSFDEIADKIADKAAKKIRDMKNFEILPVPQSDENVETAYRASEFEQKTKLISTTKETTRSSNSNSDNVLKDTVSKIDTLDIGIIKKEALNPIQGLSLKFRDFTRKPSFIFNPKVDVKQEDVDLSKNNLSYEENTRIEPMATIIKGIPPNNKVDTMPRDNSQTKEEIDENSTALKEETQEYSVEASNGDHMHQATQGQTEDTHQLPVINIESHSNSDEAPLADSAEPYTLNPVTENKHITNRVTQPPIENEQSRSPVPVEDSSSLEYYAANNQDQSKSKAVQSTVSITSTTERHKAKSKKKTKAKLMRREGGKTYTFESSPDYAEYTQQIVKQQKIT